MYRSTNTLIWRRDEGNQERWYKHGNPTTPGGTTYNVSTGVEIQRPKRAVIVTLKSRSEKNLGVPQGNRNVHKDRNN